MHSNIKEVETVDLLAKKLKLADLVDYQEGSVVSRALIDRDTGTVTIFSFDRGQGLSEHTAPYDALVYLIEGEADITITGKAYRLKTGEMILMPAKEPHVLKSVGRFKMMLTMIKS
ncbi:MAG: cupin domain-containing protein [Candidatus Bathyarchaeota archaeon]|nr:cupin domain-containing protein [Candidatus Bathyarchaeota archaeon]